MPAERLSAVYKQQVLRLFLLAQQQEVHLPVRQSRRAAVPDVEHFLPGILERSPFLSTIDFLHLQAGASYEDVVLLCDALAQPDVPSALRYISAAHGSANSLRLPSLPGQPPAEGLMVVDRYRRVEASESDYSAFVSVLEIFSPRLGAHLDTLIGSMQRILEGRLDWRKISRRSQLLEEFKGLRLALGDLSLTISAFPYQKEGVVYGGLRVMRWKQILDQAAMQMAGLKTFVNTYFRLEDLTAEELREHAELVTCYRAILESSRQLYQALFVLKDLVAADHLYPDPLSDLFIRSCSQEVVLKRGRAPRRPVTGGRLITDFEYFFPGAEQSRLLLGVGAIDFVFVEAGCSHASLKALDAALWETGLLGATLVLAERQADVRLHTISPKKHRIPTRGWVVVDEEQAVSATAREWWRLEHAMHRLNHDLRTPLSALIGFSDLITAELGQSEWKKEILRIMNRARDVSVRAEDLCDFIYHYASPEDSNSSFCGLRRVLRWCQAIVELAAEASCIKGTIDYYFEEQRLPSQVKADARFMDFCRRITNATEVFYNVLLAARDYVEGLALEHGQKLSLAEVVDRFKKFNSQCTVQIMPSLSEQEGVYASLEYLTLVIDNLTKNINEHGDKKRPGVRLVISRQDKEVRIEVRNFGTIRPDMLELGEYLDWQGNPGRTQKMFLRGTSEKEVPEGEVGVGGEIIREVVEFMQGRVSAYNNGEEAVIVLTFQYAA